jgi:hypothetical protein
MMTTCKAMKSTPSSLKELAPELEKLLKRPVTVRTLENGHTLLFDEQGVHR